MKGKPTWKPLGHRAKRWRDAGQTRGPANLLPPSKPSKEEPRGWRTGGGWPSKPETREGRG